MSLSVPEILEIVDGMEKESRALKEELFKMCWYMRGGVTLEEMYQTDTSDREVISDIITANLEMTKETKLPFF